MNRYQLTGKTLIIFNSEAPVFVRVVLFFFSFLFFVLPLAGMMYYISKGNGFHFGFIIGLAFFGFWGFYMLRLALWNTFGKEIIEFGPKKINYHADYRWFRDGKKQISSETPIEISYTESAGKNTVNLLIRNEFSCIESVIKLPATELNELIRKIKILLP